VTQNNRKYPMQVAQKGTKGNVYVSQSATLKVD